MGLKRYLVTRGLTMFGVLMIRRPPRSTQGVSAAASDVYKRQARKVQAVVDTVFERGEPAISTIRR